MTVTVIGEKELNQVFEKLRLGVANKVVRPGLNKVGRLAAKKVKAAIPSRYKDARKAIGSKSIKTKRNRGVAGVRVGAAVGKKMTKGDPPKRPGKKGVGLSSRNIHWAFLGTKERKHKTGKKKRTGKMPKLFDSVTDTIGKNASELAHLLRTEIIKGMTKEIARQAIKKARA